ncbi:chromosome segregation SMC family protein [Sphingomonas jatrophae]|uniref:Chromosome partition protein Smc n=1 Tax=Sphingomonas jatrophae TaxID=1166337 RepID=A0A1I6KY11_9SPHN|nr:AAA family ATPase [Sphingomonas jatrophae]SFR96102.1 condensin subunit Smc [Sphingomonas jatrophae]
MRIRRLRLAGFKSFVEPAELRIESGLTGVVGPNGCGKSNLLEAIRWAMGEGSPKSLRGGGMEDVIFAGTSARPPRDFAEVTIVVDGEDGETEVVRRIERGAGSAYRINGRDVRARDVALLFADAATGAHSPALVSQNRIGAIITARPAERRAMLEEAAGIAGLHVRRKEAEMRLRAAEANLARVDELLAESGTRAAALRRQARVAARYEDLSARIRVAEAQLIWARWRDAAAAATAAQQEAEGAGAAVTAAESAAADALSAQAAARTALAPARAAAEAAREAARTAEGMLAGLKQEAERVERRLAALERARESLAGDRAREDQLALDAAQALERLAAEDKALGLTLAETEAARAPAAAAVGAAEAVARDAELALAQALGRLAAEQAELRVADAALATARQRRARAEAEIARLEAEAAGLGDPAPLEARREAATLRGETAAQGARNAAAALDREEAARDAAAAARATAEEQAARARADLSALDGERSALARAEPAKATTRLLDRITCAPGWERALAAALGDELEAEVGPTRGWTGAAPQAGDPALPAGAIPLADMVEAPAELARRLAQVGLVEVDDGAALAPGQRIVTRDGRLRRWDGYRSEGEGAGAAARLVRRNRLAELDRLLPPAREAAAQARAAVDVAAATLTQAGRAIEAARRARQEAEADGRAAMREAEAAATALARLELQRSAVEDRRVRLAGDVAEARMAEVQSAEARAALPDGSEAQAAVARLRGEGAAAAAALAAARAEAAAIGTRIATTRERQEAARAEARGWRARAGDAAKRVAEMGRRQAEAEAETASLADRPAALAAAAAEAAGKLTERREQAAAQTAQERAAEAAATAADAQAQAAQERLAAAREVRAGAAARAEAQGLRRVELGRVSGERFGCPAVLLPERLGFDPEQVGAAEAQSGGLDRLTNERERLGPVNLVAAAELAELESAQAASAAEREEIGEAVNRLRGSIGSLNREGRARLRAAFEAVDGHFRRLFATLFGGGEAHLALIDSDDPLEAGLEIMAQPPGKRLSALTLLSGGEQALTAVALIFGLFLTNPAPLCVLDEVDAPLDDANIERFCDLLDRMAAETDTRYLIVTHNPVTMARMHRLFGVTMVERGVSRLASVDLRAAEDLLAAE